jgi:hypothetical protein
LVLCHDDHDHRTDCEFGVLPDDTCRLYELKCDLGTLDTGECVCLYKQNWDGSCLDEGCKYGTRYNGRCFEKDFYGKEKLTDGEKAWIGVGVEIGVLALVLVVWKGAFKLLNSRA